MSVHLTHSMGVARSRVPNQDGQRRKGGKGKDAVEKFCLYATVDCERGIKKDLLSKKPLTAPPHPPLPMQE